jgi:signal transduction histidine kinase
MAGHRRPAGHPLGLQLLVAHPVTLRAPGPFLTSRGGSLLASVEGEALETVRAILDSAAPELLLDMAPGLPDVQCDRGCVVQVLSKLLGNAVKATPATGRVSVRTAPHDDQVLFTVSDNGRGVAPQDLPHIFDRFRRGQSVAYAGSGLGLAIAKGIVEAHGGRIWAESQPGQGARFFFTVPAKASDRAGAGNEPVP